jgi:hypothetical protein
MPISWLVLATLVPLSVNLRLSQDQDRKKSTHLLRKALNADSQTFLLLKTLLLEILNKPSCCMSMLYIRAACQ